MKTLILGIAMAIWLPLMVMGQTKEYHVKSPDGNIDFALHTGEKLYISASYKGKALLAASAIAMQLKERSLGTHAKVSGVKKKSVSRTISPVVKVKNSRIVEKYNEIAVSFQPDFTLTLRAYNEGFAYRFETAIEGNITVISETGNYHFPANYSVWWGREKKFQSSNQVFYDSTDLQKLSGKDLASLPLILQSPEGTDVVVTESDLRDYPGMWMKGADGNSLQSVFPPYPKKIEKHSDRDLRITEREDYIAKTNGKRSFPWRIFAVGKDAELINNQLVYLMASPNQLKDTDWIKPGKVAWDWWNANNIYGVDFKAGINTETYKYYIDFAAKYGLEYIILDEGWYKLGNLSAIVPSIDLPGLVAYARQKNVGIILWMVWKTLDEGLENLETFEKLGIRGIKVDFMNRDDQEMVNYYHKIARLAAAHHLMVDFHGSYKPAGLRRTFPNVITREGVNGGEEVKWSTEETPEHNLILPFGRMLAGPMDYTPGAMHNAQEKDFRPIFDTPMSMGTRCHQLAMYVCYESPLQMLCDAPSNYYKEPECMEFLSAVPTVWDETKVLDAKISDYFFVARRHGADWYIGGMTDWSERDFELDLSFLPKGKKYAMTLYKDGINANRIAIDFKQVKKTVDATYKEKIHLAKGGGFAIMLKPVDKK